MSMISSNSQTSIPMLDLSRVKSNIRESNDTLNKYRQVNKKFKKGAPRSIQEQFEQDLDYFSVTSSEFEEEKEVKRANSCFQPIGQRDLSVGSSSKIPSNLIECFICKKMITKAIFEKHDKLCQEAKNRESYYKYQQE
jgi:hypothetical protein